ncbi:putative Sporulation related protein [Sterolibacterium denitrificans]|uniref:Sporulation related protein n=1 Tax=Sterolibacterium denitrificans TaxID=157592 RepID=A0A7Z7MUG1_9PROT|nr:SPOR domain-containing protein [Sterolibacterium denitrificans]SMB22819.1 putative Sporulation related protein [Sterolibacterium denitrificans]
MASDTNPDIDAAGDRDEEGANDFKRHLLLRAGIAALLIAVLLAGLMLFDEANTPKPKSADTADNLAEAPTRPTRSNMPPPSTAGLQVPPLTEDAAAGAVDVEKATEAEEAGEAKAADVVEETSAAPEFSTPPERPLTKPATARLATLRPQAAGMPEQVQPGLRSEASRELKRQARPALAPASASRPLSQAAARATTAGKGYLLQLGVFNNLTHAEELRAKLELNGIPAQIEARVQAGPYASREEAEQMRGKLRQLGLEEAVLVATKK